jgi:hypothetical protein
VAHDHHVSKELSVIGAQMLPNVPCKTLACPEVEGVLGPKYRGCLGVDLAADEKEA